MRWFIASTGCIFLGTGAAKLATIPMLPIEQMDQMAAMETWRLLFVTGVIEISAAVFIFRSAAPIPKLSLNIVLSMLFWLYRIGHWILGTEVPCPCLGASTQGGVLKWMDTIMKGLLAYLLLGGWALLYIEGRSTNASSDGNVKRLSNIKFHSSQPYPSRRRHE